MDLISKILLFFSLFSLSFTQIYNNYGCKQFGIDWRCIQCSNRYFLDHFGFCQPVSQYCKEYNQLTGACLSCYQGSKLIETACLPNYLFSNKQLNCHKYENGKCVECSYGFFFNLKNECEQVDPNCKAWNSKNGECLSCYDGYGIKNGQCKKLQTILDPYCRRFIKNLCLQCSNSYYFNKNGECQKIDDNCRNFNQNSEKCQGCYPGYELNILDQCIRRTNDPNSALCKIWSSEKCIQCSKGSYMNQNGICIAIDPLCADFDINSKNCKGCYNGYILLNGVCQITTESYFDRNCRKFINGVCNQCSYRYFRNDAQRCQLISPLCKQFQLLYGKCTKCYLGYQLINGNCQQMISSNKNALCAQWNGDICSSCSKLSYMDSSGFCMAVDPLCKTYEPLRGLCTSCFKGYIFSEGKCVINNLQLDKNCSQFDGELCKKCSNGFYFDDRRKCVEANPLCKTFRIDNGNCESCYIGYQLLKGNCQQIIQNQIKDPNCISFQNETCIKCLDQYFIGRNGKCQAVNSLCKTFNSSNGLCKSCYRNFVLINGDCIFQLIDMNSIFNKKIENCQEISDDGLWCKKCKNGYTIGLDGTCS